MKIECEYCKDGKCQIAVHRTEKLTKNKYSWVLENYILFDEPRESKSGNTKYLSAISLIHPSQPDTWIVQCERHNKIEDNWYQVYRLYRDGDCIEFDDILSMNKWLRRSRYDGRLFELEDFNRKEEE